MLESAIFKAPLIYAPNLSGSAETATTTPSFPITLMLVALLRDSATALSKRYYYILYFLEIYKFNSFAFAMISLGLVGFFDVFSCFHLKWWCFFVVLKGFCPYGDSCKYLHTNFATSQGKIFAFMEIYIAGN
jgi:hypothetical protein